MDYWRIHRLGLVSLCAHNRIKAKRKELYQNEDKQLSVYGSCTLVIDVK